MLEHRDLNYSLGENQNLEDHTRILLTFWTKWIEKIRLLFHRPLLFFFLLCITSYISWHNYNSPRAIKVIGFRTNQTYSCFLLRTRWDPVISSQCQVECRTGLVDTAVTQVSRWQPSPQVQVFQDSWYVLARNQVHWDPKTIPNLVIFQAL